jgi:hypothetical protein
MTQDGFLEPMWRKWHRQRALKILCWRKSSINGLIEKSRIISAWEEAYDLQMSFPSWLLGRFWGELWEIRWRLKARERSREVKIVILNNCLGIQLIAHLLAQWYLRIKLNIWGLKRYFIENFNSDYDVCSGNNWSSTCETRGEGWKLCH